MLSVLIPAYNEATRIGQTVLAVKRTLPEAQCLVIDDGSQDATAQRAEEAGADLVLRCPHRGKGAALQAGLRLATGDILLLLDADLEETAAAATALVEPVCRGEADMSIAIFPKTLNGGGFGLVVRLARWGIRKLTGHTFQAPLSGQRALKRELLEQIGGFETGWGAEVGLTVRALRLGARLVEMELPLHHRVTGRRPADVLHRAMQFYAVARILLRLWLTPHHRPEAATRKQGAP
ncbi:glycosyl transferase [Chthonomonas calidirosea]|uniref:Glucosyl-3-phosphoglycerate synthase n=1 Tax=Chthonomonas calidirosea (strain DSM 23976 / ICMP 18418 / T49) TaxID=1303518 RepID=S0EV84_CHTCT|nr:glycosyltransferase [Chthonomonas calidirosea]CCW35318.1 Glycosyltransferases involved in cell wall biogenesis [Chthonomonas calidirosea T49]CEK20622.1 glycosyl transferase [Chthonomonas calidirosea]